MVAHVKSIDSYLVVKRVLRAEEVEGECGEDQG